MKYWLLVLLCYGALGASAQTSRDTLEDEALLITPIETMPRFPGCEHLTDHNERKQCSDKKLLEFVYTQIHFPPSKRWEHNASGIIIASFIVEANGNITNAEIVRDLTPFFSEQVIDIVNAMPCWIPATQWGKKVRVKYHLPVRIKLW